MSGDMNPDETIEIINKYFGEMKANPNLPERPQPKESPIKEPVVKEVMGLDAESVALAWRMPTTVDDDVISALISSILYNGQAGLLDVNLNQQQKVLGCFAGSLGLSDYYTYMISGQPKQGQTLDEVKDLMLAEVDKLRKGEFDEELLQATINNYKLYYMKQLESNQSRADMFVSAFVDGDQWSDVVNFIDKMSKVNKQQVVDFANKYFADNFIPERNPGKQGYSYRTCIPRLRKRHAEIHCKIRYRSALQEKRHERSVPDDLCIRYGQPER